MKDEWVQEVKREYAGNDVRFDFPRRPLGWFRLVGLFLVGFGVLFVWMPGHTTWESIQKLQNGNRDLGSVIFSVFPLLFVIAGCLPMGIGAAILLGRCRVEWRDGQLRCAELVGPLRWTRRLPRKPVRKLEVAAATARSGNSGSAPKALENFAGVAALYEDGSRKMIVLGYPKQWMLALAEELKTHVGSAGVWSEPPKVEVVDEAHQAEDGEETILQRPSGSNVQFEEHGRGIRLEVPPLGLWKGSKGLFIFSLLWCAFMCFFTGLTVFAKGSGGMPTAFWIFIPAFWMIGLGLLAGAVNMGRRRAELTADSSRLHIEIVGLFGARQRDWSRAEIAAVRADSSGMEVNERPIIELQVHPERGKKAGFLAGRDEAELRWIAAHLRRVLKVPARRS